eukprot:CAMPEP_0196812024 /NCGR_PEP_ID=MMETSP1362-20130617/20192_1 /TAXON_ID=163516 /ORGANISM="Leptocylindrus danicus, Strain CCMP1856" /LENGTH=256 /DNA_ID=CAMNT_0042187439 /DNA_START=95 /DNA_END=862 /DNA_ORIENTATION=+
MNIIFVLWLISCFGNRGVISFQIGTNPVAGTHAPRQRQHQQGWRAKPGSLEASAINEFTDMILGSKSTLTQISSCLTTYIACVIYFDRPRGKLIVDEPDKALLVKASQVDGAGLGLFAGTYLPKGTVLGTYPGVVRPLEKYRQKKLEECPNSSFYIWSNYQKLYVIDPTDSTGKLPDLCYGGTDDYPLSELILSRIYSQPVSTKLARINEPPLGLDCNVCSVEDGDKQEVRFITRRDVFEGEEFFLDYGSLYDRSN